MVNSALRHRREEIESARAAGASVHGVIADSWSRCRSTIDERRCAAPVDAEPDEVRDRWERSPIRRAGVAIEDQLERAADASGLIAAITDDEGRILWTAGDRKMRATAAGVGFVPGGRWDEPSAGTNALGLALLTGEVSTVFAAEHWCDAVHDWVCWSAPVRDRTGRRVGVLDLSGRWDANAPMADVLIATLGRLVEEHLPHDVVTADVQTLRLRLLGHPEATLGGVRLALSPRQAEILAALAIEGPSSLEHLQMLVYGDRPVSAATIKAEISHLRRALGGAIDSRPYRLTVPIDVDVLHLRTRLQSGDLRGATEMYTGQLLPGSESPFAIDRRHVIDATLRRTLLELGTVHELLRFADVHHFDEAVLERAVHLCEPSDPLHHEATARLEIARRS